jgi:hypothetical protein
MWGALREMTKKMSGCGWLCAPRTRNIKRKTKQEAFLGQADID